MSRFLSLFLLLASCVSVFAQSLSQIQQDIHNGNYSLAERELKQGLSEHPSSARGYYDLAYVEYKLNNIGEARAAIAKCRALDPTLSFAHNESEVFQLVNQLEGAQQSSGPVPSSHDIYSQHSQAPYSGLTSIGLILAIFLLLGLALVVGIVGIFFWSRRSLGNSYVPSSNINSPVYGNVNPPIVQQGNTTTSFLEGLALGGVGGALLDETLRPRSDVPPQVIEEERPVYVDPPTRDPNIPFDSGNNDSWSDGTGGGSSSDAGSSSSNSDW